MQNKHVKLGMFIPFLAKGGAGRAVSRISELLADDFELYIILFDESKIDFEYRGTIIDMNLRSVDENLIRKLIRSIKRVRALKAIKKKYKLDVVISFLDIANICNVLTRSKACKAIVSVRGSILNYKADGITDAIKKQILKRLYRRSDRVITVSKVLRQELIKRFSLPQDSVITIYNPFDQARIREQAEQEIGEDTKNFIHEKMVLITAGQFVFAKGYWHLLKAFKTVNNKMPDTVLLICGEGEQEYKIKQLINDLSLQDNVKILGFQKNLFSYMNVSDAYVLSSVTEGFPNVLVEAMACGLPVVAADCVSGPREILIDEPRLDETVSDVYRADYGILTAPLSPLENWDSTQTEECEAHLASAVELLLGDEALLEHYSQMSKLRCAVFNNEACKKAYTQAVSELIFH